MLRGRTAPTPTSRGGLEGAEPRWGEVMGATSKGCPQGCVCLMLRLRKHCHVLRGTTQEYNSVTLLQMYRVAQPPPRSTFRTFPSPKRSLVPVCNDSPSCSQPPATTHLLSVSRDLAFWAISYKWYPTICGVFKKISFREWGRKGEREERNIDVQEKH